MWIQVRRGQGRRCASSPSKGPSSRRFLSVESLENREVPSTAQFIDLDTRTQGLWSGSYGTEGVSLAGSAPQYPAYAQVAAFQQSSYTWKASTTDTRAPVGTAGGTTSASCWYGNTFTLDVNLTDGKTHQVALYTLDWDKAGRKQRIDVIDLDTGTLKDTRTISSFEEGKYLTYDVSGHVQFKVTSLSGPNAVVSGLFFDPSDTVVSGSAPASAAYLRTDTATQGKWSDSYGKEGTSVAGSAPAVPTYASLAVAGQSWTWKAATTDPRAPTIPGGSTQAATCWYGSTLTIDLNLKDGKNHQVALYALDWDAAGRSERIDVIDVATGKLLDSQTLSSFQGGKYVVFNVSGQVQFKITSLSGPNAVISGVFFDAAASTTSPPVATSPPVVASPPVTSPPVTTPPIVSSVVSFLGSDATTQGKWIGSYGKEGTSVAAASPAYPAYAKVSMTGLSPYTWVSATTDLRALSVAGGTSKPASTWYGNTFSLDVELTDGKSHQIALYMLDWDKAGRTQRIDVIDPVTGKLLDTQTVSNFQNGMYLIYDVSSRVQFKITSVAGTNAVIGGIFFDASGSVVIPPVSPPPVVTVPPVVATPPVVTSPPVSSAVSFLGYDGSTQGVWTGAYGQNGASFAGSSASIPSYAKMSVSAAAHTWAPNTADPRALTTPGGTTGLAGCWYGGTVTIDVDLIDGQTHQVSLYTLDWDQAGRSQRVDVIDPTTGQVLATQTYSGFGGGQYLVYNVTGHVQFKITGLTGPNGVISGVFFDAKDATRPPLTTTAPQGPTTPVPQTSKPASGSTNRNIIITSETITTPYDTIPNFGGHPTISAVKSGLWSDPATWGGRVPTTGDIVSIPSGATVSYNQVSDLRIDTVAIQAGGTLQFRTDISTRLRVTNLLVMPDATLTVGTVANPVSSTVKAEIIINNVAFDNTLDPSQFGHGLVALGTVSMHGSAMSATNTSLAVEARAGQTILTLASPVTGWRVGDRLVLADSRQYYGEGAPDATELVYIAAISADGRTVTLTAPLAYDHLGARDPDGKLTFLPSVGIVTHNVVFKSESSLGVRGHAYFTMRAVVDIRYVQFAGLGRTTNANFDSTTYDQNGNVIRIGTNQADRYGVNFRHLMGPLSTPANGYQYTFKGNSVLCPMNEFVYRWGIGIADSHYGLVDQNVLYNWAGAGIALQTGNETQNTITGNFISHIAGTRGGPVDRGTADVGHEGAGIWSASFDNIIDNNVVADAMIGYSLSGSGNGFVNIPLRAGADPGKPGDFVTVNRHATPILSFSSNEVYGGSTEVGLYIWTLGMGENRWDVDPNMPESVVKDMKIWHVSHKGYYGYESNRLTFDGLVARGDVSLITSGRSAPTMFFAGDYIQEHFKITNSDVQGFGVAWNPSSIGAHQEMSNTYLRNYADVVVTPPWWLNSADALTMPRTIVLRNNLYEVLNVPERVDWLGSKGFVVMAGQVATENRNLMGLTEVQLLQYQGNASANYRVHFNESAANAIVPLTQKDTNVGYVRVNGAQQSGLTNAQSWAKYGTAFGGAVAPSTAKKIDNIIGLTESIDAL